MQFVEPNRFDRPGFSIGKDHSLADKFGLSATMLIAAGLSVTAALVGLGLIETNPRKARPA